MKLYLCYSDSENTRSENQHSCALAPAASSEAALVAVAADAATRGYPAAQVARWATQEVASDNANIAAVQWFSGRVARPLLPHPRE